jgi:hypothetical protein
MFTTKVIDGKVYLCNIDTMCFEPKYIISYWLTNTPAHDELNNLPVYELAGAKYVKMFGKDIAVNPIADYAEFTETMPVKRPSKRHVWKYGEWVKQ